MPHILTTALTHVAIALLEAALLRLSVMLWKSFVTGGRPAVNYA
ncbi:hypothetical protein ACIBVL_02300 [Streptomyces sp. NPDC049687]